MTQASSQKAYAAAASSPFSVLLMWGLQGVGLEMPPEAMVALGGLISSAVTWFVRN